MKKTIMVVGRKHFFGQIQDVLSPLGLHFIYDGGTSQTLARMQKRHFDAVFFDDDFLRLEKKRIRKSILKEVKGLSSPFVIVSSRHSVAAIVEAKNFGAADYIARPFNYREFFSRARAIIEKKVRITCLGGGTGLFQILLGLKKLPRILLTSVVSMSDDGGSSGKLRTSFGILPPGDIRRSLVALSNAPHIMNELMKFRFQRGGHFSGHNLGNLFLTALTEIKGSVSEAVRAISDILNVQGIVLPVTGGLTTLCARFENDVIVKGESRIDLAEGRNPNLRIQKVWHEPKVACSVDAFSALMNAEYVIVGPGDLYTSIITNLLVNNIRKALRLSDAKKIYVCNLMTKPGETAHYSAFDHVREMKKYLGGDCLDYILLSNTKLSHDAITDYKKMNQFPVDISGLDRIERITRAKIIVADVGHKTELVRHEGAKVRKEIFKIIKGNKQ